MSDHLRSREALGLFWGIVGVASFSLTLPAARAAVPHLGVGFVSLGRAIGAGVCAALILWATKQPWPARDDLKGLALVSLGVVFGFPFLTTLAMAAVPASHGAIVIALLPLSTAIAGVYFTGERPSLGFWLASLVGTLILVAFVWSRSDGHVSAADVALLGAVAAGAIGYAKGGQLSVRLGGWQVICWTLALSLPLLLVLAPILPAPFAVTWPRADVPTHAWLAFAYVTLVSQLTGFFAWYYGLALGGIARVSQTQMLQVFLTLIAAAVLLGEPVDASMYAYAAAVVATVLVGIRMRAAAAFPGMAYSDRDST